MRKYSWTKHHAVDAQIVGEIIESLPAQNEAELIKRARNKSSPIHHLFEWDETKAAQQYRLLQARLIMSSLHVEVISVKNEPITIKAYIKQASKSGNYVAVQDATDEDLTAEEAKCLRHMKRFKAEHAGLAIARGVISEIRQVELSMARKGRKKRRVA